MEKFSVEVATDYVTVLDEKGTWLKVPMKGADVWDVYATLIGSLSKEIPAAINFCMELKARAALGRRT